MSKNEYDWAVSVRADRLKPGMRFYFDEKFGGEGDVVTVVSSSNAYGLLDIEVEEYDFALGFLDSQMVRLVPAPEGEDL